MTRDECMERCSGSIVIEVVNVGMDFYKVKGYLKVSAGRLEK